jgi:ubiquinone/menaquinone biosynthesis C-methylase UbiE
MDELELLLDLHVRNLRQGPGSDAMTRRAIELAGLRDRANLQIADIGCGTGSSALVLAQELDAKITAVDFLAPFLEVLGERAIAAGLAAKITPQEASMESLPFAESSLDVIWSEGAIYNIGFEQGVREWKRFLKPGGILAASELTWLTHERPEPLQAHWDAQYLEVATASHKIAILEQHGYRLLGYFPLPDECWMENYYQPLRHGFADFLQRHDSDAVRAIVAEEESEIALYERYRAFVSYGFYIAQRIA